jgi:hypothetical protein
VCLLQKLVAASSCRFKLAVAQNPSEILNRLIVEPDGARREARSRIRPPLEDEFGKGESVSWILSVYFFAFPE